MISYRKSSAPKESLLKRTWFKWIRTPTQNFVWIAAGGCFTLFLGAVLTFRYAQSVARKSDFNITALTLASENKKFMELLGSPVEADEVFLRKKNSITDDTADCVVPVHGTKAEGLLKYQAHKDENGKWIIRRMEFTFLDEAGGVLRLK